MEPYRLPSNDFAPAAEAEDEGLSPFAIETETYLQGTGRPEHEDLLGSPFLPGELAQPDPIYGREDEDSEQESLEEPSFGHEETGETLGEYDREWEHDEAEAEDEFDSRGESEMEGWDGETATAAEAGWAELELPDTVFSHEEEGEPEAELEEEAAGSSGRGLSSLARRAAMHPGHGARKGVWRDQVYGLVVHTSGGTLPGKARKAGVLAADYAVRYYANSGGTHYVNGWAGAEGQQLYQVMDELKQAWGVGVRKDQPQLDQWRSAAAGRFEADLPPTVLRLWRARWPGFKDSLSLLPVRASANLTYVHVECTPCVYYQGGNGRLITDPEYAPMRAGLRFTRAQHETVARLAWDIAQRHGWPAGQTWWRTPRLLGHEDITPLSRCDKNGGWDPGGLREQPYFDWPFVYDQLQRLSGGSAVPGSASGGIIAGITSTVGSLLGGFAERFRALIRGGQESQALTEAVRSGQTDVNKLANLVFYARHPELNGRPIRREERALAAEWLQIRDTVVRPVVARLAPSGGGSPVAATPASVPAAAAPAAGSGGTASDAPPRGPFGTLTVSAPEQYRFNYRFTGDDAAWIARLITGESGGRNDTDSAAVIWAVFNRFALFTHSGSYWMKRSGYRGYPTLAEFVQAYSTTLQPTLKSVGAAKRAIEMARTHPAKFQYVETGGTYSGTNIPRGQLKHHLDRIQQLRWSRLPQETRDIVMAAFTGALRSPIGLASEFANTATYYRDAYKKRPDQAAWREFTLAFARKKKWTWVDNPSLRQFQSNAFFVDNRVKDLPADTVRVVP